MLLFFFEKYMQMYRQEKQIHGAFEKCGRKAAPPTGEKVNDTGKVKVSPDSSC